MLHIIIFSFNRAAQLDILLNSLFKYWEQPNIYVSVLYNTSSVQLEKGYELLKKKTQQNKWPVIFYKEKDDFKGYTIKEKLNPINFYRLLKYKYIRSPRTDFRAQLLSLLNDNQSELVMFLTDDAEFISPVNISSANINWLLDNPLCHQFSLRLGHGMDNEPTSIIDEGIDYLEWNFSSASENTNWGYSFSVDAHIYNKKLIHKLFSKYVFINPNTLEGLIWKSVKRLKWFQIGRCPLKHTLLSFPINMVQTVADNETLGVSVDLINDYYLEGYTMEYLLPNKIEHFQVYPSEIAFRKGDEYIIKRIK